MLRRSKKGQESGSDVGHMWQHAFLIMLSLPVFFGLFFWILGDSTSHYVPDDLIRTLDTEKFVNACFSYVDAETQRVYTGIIDTNKFTSSIFASCYPWKPGQPEYGLRLLSDGIDEEFATPGFVGGSQFIREVVVYNRGVFQQGTLFIQHGGRQ